MTEFKRGDIVRYGAGCSALVRLDKPHAGGWHGVHCLGGYNFVSNISMADADDVATYERLRAQTLKQQGRREERFTSD